MASRRMFNREIIDSDNFLEMPSSSQNLYFHLAMRADDDGFVNNPKKIQRIIGASDDDARILITKKYIFNFESGIVVIKHWRLHNYLRKDRYKPSINNDESELLSIKENGEYSLQNDGIPLVAKRLTQYSIGKTSKAITEPTNMEYFKMMESSEKKKNKKARSYDIKPRAKRKPNIDTT